MPTYADLGMATDGPGYIRYRDHSIHEDHGAFTVLGFQHKAPTFTADTTHAVMAWIDAQTAILATAYQDWTANAAYIDGQGNYHVRKTLSGGPIAPWNKTIKRLYANVSLFHAAANQHDAAQKAHELQAQLALPAEQVSTWNAVMDRPIGFRCLPR